MSSHCVNCDRSFDSNESLQQHKRESPAHTFDCRTCHRHYTSKTALQQHQRDSPVHAPSFKCGDCNRSFHSEESLQHHVRDSPVHGPSFNCEACNRSFVNEPALQQHRRDSPVHVPSFNCGDCGRVFQSEESLQHHVRDSPAHAPTFNCEACNRSFVNEPALQQHLRESPVHVQSFDCDDCNQSFNNEEALQSHLQNSPAHAPTFNCETCNRPFGSETALQQHLRDSPIHQPDTETPLDIFFRTFPTFDYDPSLPPATSYAKLRRHEGWRERDLASKDAWDRYQDALRDELRKWYGEESDLSAWHALCRAIGVEPLPTCEQCERAVRRTHVNIVDLIEWGRRGSEEKVRIFHNFVALRDYTRKTGKVFSYTPDEEDDNVVLRHLLRRIFNPRLRNPLQKYFVAGKPLSLEF